MIFNVLKLFLLLSLLLCKSVYAEVILLGTRVIFDSSTSSTLVFLENTEKDKPYLVQD